MAEPAALIRSDAAEHLKAVALKLFAERGIDGVTVRQIAESAGQKNHAAVGYYFGSKEELVRELIVDGARLIDHQRNLWLDAAEAKGGPHTVLEAVEGLVRTSLNPAPPEWGECYNRFVVMLGLTHRARTQCHPAAGRSLYRPFHPAVPRALFRRCRTDHGR